MKIDLQELQQLAAAQPRVDMYSGIHKALRACMAETLLAVGSADPGDDAAVAHACSQVEELLDFCAGHVQHENDHVHRAMEARASGSAAAVAHEHEEHVQHLAQLRALAQALRQAALPLRAVTAQRLYRELALFVADNLRHMHVEETAHNAVLWARYTEAELVAIHDALIASVGPAEMMLAMRWMVPALNPAERLGLLADIRAKAPAPAFQAILDTVRPHLGQAEWAALARGLGLAPAPGLVAG